MMMNGTVLCEQHGDTVTEFLSKYTALHVYKETAVVMRTSQ